MKKMFLGAALALAAPILLSGCLVAPVIPPVGIIYSDLKAPLDYDQEASTVGPRTGTSESMSILGLVAMGDASVQAAAQNGNITKANGADYEYFNVLGIYQRYRTVLHGE